MRPVFGLMIQLCRYKHAIIRVHLLAPILSDIATSALRMRASHALYRAESGLAYTPRLSLSVLRH
jgi:hypothetical protein